MNFHHPGFGISFPPTTHEKMLNISNHQGNGIKTTVSYYLTPVRMAIVKKKEIRVGKNVEKREHLCTVAGNIN